MYKIEAGNVNKKKSQDKLPNSVSITPFLEMPLFIHVLYISYNFLSPSLLPTGTQGLGEKKKE